MNKNRRKFNEEDTIKLEAIEKKFFENPIVIDEMFNGVLETLLSFGLSLIKEHFSKIVKKRVIVIFLMIL